MNTLPEQILLSCLEYNSRACSRFPLEIRIYSYAYFVSRMVIRIWHRWWRPQYEMTKRARENAEKPHDLLSNERNNVTIFIFVSIRLFKQSCEK